MVRDTFNMRWKAQAERLSRWVAVCRRPLALSSSWQYFQTSAGLISGLHKEAAFLEPRPLNFSVLCYPQSGTAGILGLLVFNQLFVLHRRNFHEHIDQSSSGPLMRFWYRVTVDGEQLHSLVG